MSPSQMKRRTLLQIVLAFFISTQIPPVESLLVRPIAYGTNLSLTCPRGSNSNSTLHDLQWYKDGQVMLIQSGVKIYNVINATFGDSGIYSCQTHGSMDYIQQTKVIVGTPPNTPPESVCYGSRTPMITCTFYSGSHGDFKLCWAIANTNRYVWYNECENNVQNVSFTFLLEEPELLLTTTVSNGFGSNTRTDNHTPIVQPDPPMITGLVSTGIDTFNVSFKIQSTWNIDSWLNYRGNYMQNGNKNTLTMAFCRRTLEVSLSLMVHSFPYSLVCLTIQLQNGIMGPYLDVDSFLWSNFSKPVCSYTPMAAPYRSPNIFRVSVTQSQSNLKLKSVTLSWTPPPEEYRNGIIDHYELHLILQNETIREYKTAGNMTEIVIKDLESYLYYIFRLHAWTVAGRSPPFVYILHPLKSPEESVKLLTWMSLLFCSVFLLAVHGRIICVIKEKMSSNHLPEPYFIPEAKMNLYMSKKRPPPFQKEIFDDLKQSMTIDIINTEPDYHHGVQSFSCNYSSFEESNSFISSTGGANIDTTTIRVSNEGTSAYIIAESSSLNECQS